MKNFRKVIALVLAVAMMLSTFTTSFAAEKTSAEKLNDLGLLSGITASELEKTLSREVGITMVLKALGYTQADADAAAATTPFTDTPGWVKGWAALAAAKGITAGKTTTTFVPADTMTEKEFVTFMLRALGYESAASWTDTAALAASSGLSATLVDTTFVKSDAAAVMFNALSAAVTGGTGAKLYTTLTAITSAQAIAAGLAPAELAVVSVAAINAKQVEVVFNTVIDATTATAANFQVYQAGDATNADRLATGTETTIGTINTGSVKVSEGGTTAVITLDNLAGLTNDKTVTVVVGTGVKSDVGVALTATATKTATFKDLSVPTAVSATVTGNKTIEIEFTEPMTTDTDVAAADLGAVLGTTAVTVDSGAMAVSGVARKGSDAKVLVVTLAAAMGAGEHTIVINPSAAAANVKFRDYVNYDLLSTTLKTTYVADTTVPTLVSAEAKSETKVRFTFSKSVTFPANANIEFRYAYNTTTANKVVGSSANVVVVAGSNNTQYDVTFGTAFTPGTANVYIAYVSSTDTTNVIKDLFGNTLASGAVSIISVVQDVTKPTVSSVTYVNATTIDVTYSEAVTAATALDATKYVLKKGTTAYSVTPAWKTASTVVRLTTASMAAGGTFTLDVSGIKDTSVTGNTMDAYSTSLVVSDTVAPTITSVSKDAAPATKFYIQYNEPMAITGQYSVLDASNYRYSIDNGVTMVAIPAAATLAMNGTVVTMTLPSSVAVTHFYVGQVSDVIGNKIATLQSAFTAGTLPTFAGFTPAVTSIQFTARNTASFKVDRQLTSVNAGLITTTGVVSTADSASFVNNADGTATVTATFNANQATDLTAIGNLGLAAGALTDLSNLANAVSATAVVAATADKIAPAVTSATTGDTDADGKIDKVTVVMSENVYSSTIQDTDFTVAGYAIASVSPTGVDGTTFTITLTELGNYDTAVTPVVTMAGAVSDVRSNVATAVAVPATVDGAAPVLVRATISTPGATAGFGNDANDQLTLVYSEPVFAPVANWVDAAPTPANLNAAFTFSAATLAGLTFTSASIDTVAEATNTIVVTATNAVVDVAVDIAVGETITGKNAVVVDALSTPQVVGTAVTVD